MRRRISILLFLIPLFISTACIDFDDGGPDPNDFPSDSIGDHQKSFHTEALTKLGAL